MLSMTGFGRAVSDVFSGSTVAVEVSSINRKQLEVRLSLPAEFAGCETELRNVVSKHFSRGAVSVRVSVSRSAENTVILPEQDSFDRLIKYVSDARKRNNIAGEVNVEALLSLPQLWQSRSAEDADNELKKTLLKTAEHACMECCSSRAAEGAVLKQDFYNRLKQLEELLEKVKLHIPETAAAAKERLLEKIAALGIGVDMNDSAFLREVVYLTDKSDVTEEVVRLQSHFVQFKDYLSGDKACGRNLDFLAQEMFREINTLGNKCGNTSVSPLVVSFKTELEKIREQIQNVE